MSLALLSMYKATLAGATGALVSMVYRRVVTAASLPAVSLTLTFKLLLPLRVWLAKLQELLPTLVLAVCQLLPLSVET